MQLKLEREGYRVTVADDGPTALAAIAADPPDLVLLDWMMPGASGLDVCRALRAEGHRTPVVLLTAKADADADADAYAAGADSYLTKPFSPRALGEHVAAVLAAHT